MGVEALLSSSISNADFGFLVVAFTCIISIIVAVLRRNAELENRISAAQDCLEPTTNTHSPHLPCEIYDQLIIPYMDDGWGVEKDGVYTDEFIIPVPSSENAGGLVFRRHAALPFSKGFIASLLREGKASILKQVYKVDTGIFDMEFELRNCKFFDSDSIDSRRVLFAAYAAAYDQLEILEWLQQINILDPNSIKDICLCAAERGHLRILDWLRDQQYPRMPPIVAVEIALTAARKGDLNVLQWLLANEYEIPEQADGWAAKGAQKEVLEWLRANGFPVDGAGYGAALGGHIEVLEWIHANGVPLVDAGYGAAAGGHTEVWEWLLANGIPLDPHSCAQAALNGRLEMLRWLRANGCPWDEQTFAYAVYNGHLEMAQWLRDNGCPWDAETCASAAQAGQLGMLQWLRAHGCPWDENSCRNAALYGQLEVLQWLRANGCPENVNG